VTQPFYVSGWAWRVGADGRPEHAWLRLLPADGDAEGREFPAIATTERPDVAAFLKNDAAIESGFDVQVKDLAAGRYRIELVFEQVDGPVLACGESREVVLR
jgi:hypothetical protein